jgi:formylglycine-generating enzyme required for sulfatase activity
MKKVFILLGGALLAEGAFGEVLSNALTNGATVYSCTSVPIEMVLVQGGSLPADRSSTGVAIAVQDFYIGKYEVTQKQWKEVMGTSIQDMWTAAGYSGSPTQGVGDNYPMYCVSWDDAQAFITKLNELYGNGKFRLPTEAEWEYAARGGNPQQSYTYAGSNTIGNVAWYTDNSSSTTHVVGGKAANGINAHDMSGNVREWCEDWYTSSVAATPPGSGSYRIDRGGSWDFYATVCTVSFRVQLPVDRSDAVGFRLACSSNP